jgi:hypothetical protein
MPPLSSEEILSGLIYSANSDNKTLQEEIEKLKYRVYNLEKNVNSIMQIIREMK